jgi:hypothetical protein
MNKEWERLEEEADELGCKDTIKLLREIGATFKKLIQQRKELEIIHLKRLNLMIELEKITKNQLKS